MRHRYLQRLSGYSRAQITRLVSRWEAGKPLVKNYGAPRHPFARLYTPDDGALLVDVDRAMGTPRLAECGSGRRAPPTMLGRGRSIQFYGESQLPGALSNLQSRPGAAVGDRQLAFWYLISSGTSMHLREHHFPNVYSGVVH